MCSNHRPFPPPVVSSAGKTNHGIHLFGHAMRFKDVLLCPIGALAFHLFYRFTISGEMEPPPDFTDNSAWFDIKLYTDCTLANRTKGIGASVYGDSIGRVFKVLNMRTKHTAHIGRKLGPKSLEMQEFSQDDIRILGNWDPKTQESTYSTKLPMAAIRAMAGFKDGAHYNPRTTVEVPEELASAVFPWLRESQEILDVFQEPNGSTKVTAMQFLKQCGMLAKVVIQDAVVIKLCHPERCANCLLMGHSLFNSDRFAAFMEDMRKALQEGEENNPRKTTVESVLPGVLQSFTNLHHEIDRVRVGIDELKAAAHLGITGKDPCLCLFFWTMY